VNQNSFRSLQLNFSGASFWLTLLLIVWLLGSIGLGWLVKSFFILLGLLLIAPVVAFFGFRWWLQRNLVQADCPVCHYELAGVNGTEMKCPNCSEPLKVNQGHFDRLTPPGTIDVQAVEVSARRLED
jgi:Zinc-ribbon containing domain